MKRVPSTDEPSVEGTLKRRRLADNSPMLHKTGSSATVAQAISGDVSSTGPASRHLACITKVRRNLVKCMSKAYAFNASAFSIELRSLLRNSVETMGSTSFDENGSVSRLATLFSLGLRF